MSQINVIYSIYYIIWNSRKQQNAHQTRPSRCFVLELDKTITKSNHYHALVSRKSHKYLLMNVKQICLETKRDSFCIYITLIFSKYCNFCWQSQSSQLRSVPPVHRSPPFRMNFNLPISDVLNFTHINIAKYYWYYTVYYTITSPRLAFPLAKRHCITFNRNVGTGGNCTPPNIHFD